MTDIRSRKDIEYLVNSFYKQLLVDELIGVFFTEVIDLDWKIHIPVMYDFWESILLGSTKYRGNPMVKHIQLSQKKTLLPEHFDRWLYIWEQTIRENFEGEKAEEAINRAKQIGSLMKQKVQQHS